MENRYFRFEDRLHAAVQWSQPERLDDDRRRRIPRGWRHAGIVQRHRRTRPALVSQAHAGRLHVAPGMAHVPAGR